MKTKAHWFPDLNLATILEPADAADKLGACTKVVGTIGPACQSVDKLVQMIEVRVEGRVAWRGRVCGVFVCAFVCLCVLSRQGAAREGPYRVPSLAQTTRTHTITPKQTHIPPSSSRTHPHPHTLRQSGMSAARIDLTWGPIDYHRRSLDNLQEAMRRTRRLCAIMLDTLGREVMIRRPFRCA